MRELLPAMEQLALAEPQPLMAVEAVELRPEEVVVAELRLEVAEEV